ncbi:MAG: hemolysin family protein [Deltaproteobacteria bacterium]|nr:hemolysin family protein [Deltaproteobacteria bacterium]
MDRSPGRSLWSRLKDAFSNRNDDLEQAIIEARNEGKLESDEGSMLLSILRLDDVQVQDIMTPRTDFHCLPVGTCIAEAAVYSANSGHSRLPVYQDTRDNIVGIIHAKDMLRALLAPDREQLTVDSIMRPPFFVPETKLVGGLLQEFRLRKIHLAIAVDEYGGTSGLITIEDVLEEIVGEIEDEHDAPKEEAIVETAPGVLSLSGRTLLENLQKYGIVISDDEVDTIGGYLSREAGRVPGKNEEFTVGDWRFTVDKADLEQILHVIATRLDVEQPAKTGRDAL